MLFLPSSCAGCIRRNAPIGIAAAGLSGHKDYTDGLSFEATDFRFNVHISNTELVLSLNVETHGTRD